MIESPYHTPTHQESLCICTLCIRVFQVYFHMSKLRITTDIQNTMDNCRTCYSYAPQSKMPPVGPKFLKVLFEMIYTDFFQSLWKTLPSIWVDRGGGSKAR